jgi:tRNA threonylcarbamoyladenosine biosynthesis protein TsaB
MNILALDTCFGACSVAAGLELGRPTSHISCRFEAMDMGHVERLVPMITEVVAEVGIPVAAFDVIGVTVGPGTFAGTRIGIAAAKGISLASGVPLVGLSSLAVIAAEAGLTHFSPHDICVAMDVRRAEVYTQVFDCTGQIARSEPTLMTIAQARDLSKNAGITYVGSGANLVATDDRTFVGTTVNELSAPTLPNARFALDLLLKLRRSHNHHPHCAITPLYLRAPDATPPAPGSIQRL